MPKLKRIEQGLFFFTVLFLPTQLGRHFWPDFSFVYSLPLDYLSPTVYFWDLLVVSLILVWIFGKPHIQRTALNLFLLFILSQILSLVGGDEQKVGHGLVRIEQYLISGLFGIYVASANFNKIRTEVFLALGFAILAESILGIAQFIKGGTVGFWLLGERTFSLSTPGIAKFDFYGFEFLRPYASFPHPNVLAGFMVISLPLLSFLKPKTAGLMVNLCTLLGGIVTLLAASRVALVAGFFESVVFFKKRALMWLFLILIVLSPFLYIRFSAIFNFDYLSLLRREQLTEASLKIFLSHPIFGVGLNNFISFASDSLLAGPSRFLQPVHNIFLLSLAETGLVGFLGWVGLLGYAIWKGYRQQGTGYRLIWLTVMFLGLFDHYFLTLPQGYRLLFLLWGISLLREASMLKSNGESKKNI